MIDYENLYKTVVSGLEKYLGCTVIRANQNDEPPAYPYVAYTVTTVASARNGTYGVYADGKDRKPVAQTWSITALSDKNAESITLACKAREWLDHTGTVYLNDNNVYVQSVGGITNRDNFLTTEYEYRNGFDVVFPLFDVVENPIAESGNIESFNINGEMIDAPQSMAEQIAELEKQLEAVNASKAGLENAIERLKERLEGAKDEHE